MLKQLNEQFEFLQDVPVSPADFRGREQVKQLGVLTIAMMWTRSVRVIVKLRLMSWMGAKSAGG